MKKNKPEWAPDEQDEKFTSTVMEGVSKPQNMSKKIHKRKELSLQQYVDGIISCDYVVLSKAITLIESNNPNHISLAQEILQKIIPNTGNSIRIGITGPPGAGKSTFIESLGSFLCRNGLKVAVLAIDPSSTVSKGSILGDKTRMELLSREENAFIRPSPSGGTLGGVAKKTRESIMVCEAAGYDVILIETIGVGQSEVTVRSMVDFFLLLSLPGSGDELQGIKKGVVELADLIVVNKADSNYLERAKITQVSYNSALRLLAPATEGWSTKALTCSALNHQGIEAVWSAINEFMIFVKESNILQKRRSEQMLFWINSMLEESILLKFYSNESIQQQKKNLESEVLVGRITATNAVKKLLNTYFGE
ncbi:methylmalonyl Co-A mutase-associated GTPase MeaB [Candidatus Kapaibacterium sp.]